MAPTRRRRPTGRRPRTRRVPAIDRHGPVRSCVGCRRRRPWSELLRVTCDEVDGRRVVAVGGPSRGRGAWLCAGSARDGARRAAPGCLDAALARGRFERAWRTALDDDDRGAIRAALGGDEHTDRSRRR
ncbi:YlxR family protein [Ilumatobacter sp.]|uniref:YlxR family protein n=1 Tax=Ilumatobacter sp. TaxID=1967498 RepID=UPI003B519C9B